MKKCPKCGNPSYDGALTCGNCGHKFPKPKRSTDEKKSNDEDIMSIVVENKYIIGAILLITIIVICGIVLTADNNSNGNIANDNNKLLSFSKGDIYFDYPSSWEITNLTDTDHEDAVIFKNNDNTTIEYYNASSNSMDLEDLTDQRISVAQYYDNSIELINPISVDDNNASDIIIKNSNGSFTRYISILNDGTFYVFKIDGNSYDSINNTEMENMLDTVKIQ